MDKLKVIELFSGIGSQREALNRANIPHEILGISEVDKFAIDTYTQLHGETYNFGDISKIKQLPNADLWTFSFPCQSLSTAGKQEGIKKGTRSGLLLEVVRLLECSEKPKYLLMENVKNLVGKKFKSSFDQLCKKLESLGYKNYWKILNSTDYGIPQNRERVFMISILGEHTPYKFPKEIKLNIQLKDMLDSDVEEKYFLPSEIQNRFVEFPQHRFSNKINIIGTTAPNPRNKKGELIYDKCTSAWVIDTNGLCGTLAARDFKQPKQIQVKVDNKQYIRKLTPREYWKLMGWDGHRFDLIHNISNTQLYKQAGNGIVVDVLQAIFESLKDIM